MKGTALQGVAGVECVKVNVWSDGYSFVRCGRGKCVEVNVWSDAYSFARCGRGERVKVNLLSEG